MGRDLDIIALWSLSLYGTFNHLLNRMAKTTYRVTNKCIKKGDSITYNFCFFIKIHDCITFWLAVFKYFPLSVALEGVIFEIDILKKLSNTSLLEFLFSKELLLHI